MKNLILKFMVIIIMLTIQQFCYAQNIISKIVGTPSDMTNTQFSKMNLLKGMDYVHSSSLIQFQNLANSQQNGKIQLLTPIDNINITFKATWVEYTDENNYSWFGKGIVNDSVYTFDEIQLTKVNGLLVGDIVIGNNYYNILNISNKYQLFIKNRNNIIGHCNQNTVSDNLPASSSECTESKTVKILVVYPQNLADQYGSIAPYANNFNNALNFALRNSEVIHKTKIVGVELYPETWTNQNDDDPLVDVNQLHNSLSNPNSEISEMRDNYQADIVILLTKGHNYQDVSGGDGVGHTYSQYANSANDACSVVQMNSALSNAKTFQHEIGHIFGGGHEGVPNISCPSAKGYSFNLGINKYMTIMHTRSDQDPTRTRVHHFSNPDVLYNNMVSTGSNVNNVAECLNQSMCEIANYIPDGLCSFQTECNFLDLCLSNQLFIHVLGNENVPLGCSFLTYEYYYSIDGINYQFIACDNEMYYCDVQLPFYINRYQKLFIKTIVRNNLSIVDISFNAVTPFCDRPIETIKREEESQSLVNKFRLQPNVVESELKISFFYTELNEDVQFVIFDINSNVVYQYKFSITQEETNVTIDVSGLPSGFYSCIAKKNDQIQSDKFFKIKL